ncbi:MAG TPA: hypothetical protein VHE99_06910 [Gammaproteobacteria bacterium]|nr:hypothetical protein [Gammaproteobacteria bacterium]
MQKELMGRFVPCVCTIDDMHMPAISVVSVSDVHPPDVIIESVRMDYKTPDIMSAYRQAVEDYEDSLSECRNVTDINQRIQSVVSGLKKKKYVLTPKTIRNLLFNTATPEVIH